MSTASGFPCCFAPMGSIGYSFVSPGAVQVQQDSRHGSGLPCTELIRLHLHQVSKQYLNTVKYPTDDTGEPLYYGFNGSDSSNNLKIDLVKK